MILTHAFTYAFRDGGHVLCRSMTLCSLCLMVACSRADISGIFTRMGYGRKDLWYTIKWLAMRVYGSRCCQAGRSLAVAGKRDSNNSGGKS